MDIPEFAAPDLEPIYSFCGTARAFALHPRFAACRGRAIDAWEDRLFRCFHGDPAGPTFRALDRVTRRHRISVAPLRAYLDGCRLASTGHRPSTFSAVRRVLERTSHSVARMTLAVYGDRDPSHLRQAEALWEAADLATDLARTQAWIPQEDIQGLPPESGSDFQVERARALLRRGRPLSNAAAPKLQTPLRTLVARTERILARVESTTRMDGLAA